MMKKLLSVLLLILFTTVAMLPVMASSTFDVEVETYLNSSTPQPGVKMQNKQRGEKVSFDGAGLDDYDFAFYAVNGIIRDDLPFDYEFSVRRNSKITAVYHPHGRGSENNLRHVVVFADSNGYILDVQYVADLADVSDSGVVTPDKPNASIAAIKWLTSDGISELSNVNSNRVYYLQYQLNVVEQLNLTLTDATSSKMVYDFNEVAVVTAAETLNDVSFSHYEDAKGNVLSTNLIYAFTMVKDVSVKAVYASTQPQGSIVNMTDALNIRDGYKTFIGQIVLMPNTEVLEYGFIISRSSDVLTFDSLGATIIPSNVHNGQTKEFIRSFKDGSYNSIRAYAVVIGTGPEAVEEVVYSENYERSPESIGEANTKVYEQIKIDTGYEPKKIVIDSLEFSLNGTQVTNTDGKGVEGYYFVMNPANAKANPSKEASIEFEVNNVSNISFVIAPWAVSEVSNMTEFKLQVFEDDQWIDIIDLISNIPDVLKTTEYLSIDVNNNHFRLILKTDQTDNARLVIDEITLTTEPFSGPIHEIKYNVDGVVTEEMIANNGSITYEPTKEDHDFVGWYYLDAEKNQVDFSGPIIQSRTLYAKFELQSRTITFHYNGADGGQMPATQVVQIGSQAVLPIPTRTGYVFLGWFNESLTTEFDDPYTMPTINSNMYAKWEQTDEGKVLDDLNSISLPSVITETTTLDLIEVGTNESTITWSSTNETVINPISGVVTLPTDENTEVTLTATGVFNGVERSKTFVITVNKQGSSAVQKEITYKFISKSWGATSSIDGGDETAENWTSVKDGLGFATDQGIQVTTGVSGAKGTSKSIDNIVSIEVIYATNASKGKGTIEVSIGSSIVQTYTVTTVGGVTPRSAGIVPIDSLSGAVSIEVTTTTNSIYIHSIIITYLD